MPEANRNRLVVHAYKQALIVPRQKKRCHRSRTGCFADGKSVPWSNSGMVFRPSTPQVSDEPLVKARYVDKEVLFIGTLWCAWGHLITDFSRHLWPLLSAGPDLSVAYAVGGPRQKLPRNFMQLLEALGVSSDRLIEVREPMRFRKVYFGEPSFWHDTSCGRCVWTSEYAETVDAVIKGILTGGSNPWRRIYLTRTGLQKDRKDFGEKTIERAYQERGFQVVAPEKRSFVELVRLLAETEVLAATEGSVSHNALFLPKGARIEILRKCDSANEYQDAINALRELNVSVFNVSMGNMLAVPSAPWRGPFLIGITPSLAAHLGCAPVKASRSEWFKCLLCRVKMFLKAHRI